MAPKERKNRSKSPKKAEQPAAKKAKAEEPKKTEEPKKAEEPKKVEEKEPEAPKFQEPDAPASSKPKVKETIGFATAETTLNVIPAVGGKVLTCLSDGGMSCLLAGARANVGQKSGRYMFEAKILQVTDPHQGQLKQARLGLRIGFSTSDSSLMMGEDASSIYFDSEGFAVSAKKRVNVAAGKFSKGQVLALVLNLDAASPNANTIALYRDGAAVSEPLPLPEELKGKTLFPHLTFRKVSVQVNFGPTAVKELPFKCRLLQDASNSDVAVSAVKEPKDGKYEVVMPIAFPDEGTFAWTDAFLEKNPGYVELSDRKVLEWARASGLGSSGKGHHGSHDRPNFNFGIREMDDMSIRKLISAAAPVVPRNYLIMEVKSNLVADERKEVLKKFNYPCYKKIAKVMMGEPNKEYKAMVQAKILKDKQTKADSAWKAKKAEAERKKAQALRQKELDQKRAENLKKKEEEAKAKKAAAEKKKADEDKKKADEAKKEGDDVKEEDKKEEPEPKEEETKEEPAEDKKDEPVSDPMDEETEPPVVELTDEEKNISHAPVQGHDLSMQVLNTSFSKFSTPEEDEGFDDIQFAWQKEQVAKEYLSSWIMNKKLTTRIEDIKPGQTFKDKKAEFQKLNKEWQDKLAAWKKAGSKKPAKQSDEEDDVDIFSVADVNDVGTGVPLFDQFTSDDWELLKLRFELALLLLSFKTDCNDPDRAGIPCDHLNFYCGKYYGTSLNPKQYGQSDLKGVLGMVKDIANIKDGLVQSQLTDGLESLDIFVKLTEEHRRERQRRIDAGDETARLKFAPVPQPKPKPEPKVAAKPADAVAAPKVVSSAKGSTPAAKGSTVPASGKGVTVPVKGGKEEPKGWGKSDAGKGAKDQGKAWGKDQGKDQGKSWGKDQGKDQGKVWGKDQGKGGGGKDKQKGFGKGGKW